MSLRSVQPGARTWTSPDAAIKTHLHIWWNVIICFDAVHCVFSTQRISDDGVTRCLVPGVLQI